VYEIDSPAHPIDPAEPPIGSWRGALRLAPLSAFCRLSAADTKIEVPRRLVIRRHSASSYRFPNYHILLGLLQDGEGLAAIALGNQGVTLEKAREGVVRMLDLNSHDDKPQDQSNG
jgi:ClpA/ClpB-like protein